MENICYALSHCQLQAQPSLMAVFRHIHLFILTSIKKTRTEGYETGHRIA